MEKNPYYFWAEKEIGNENPIIDLYAKLITQEYDKFFSGEITLEEFEINTPKIDEESSLNYIRDRIIESYSN
jgi:hypothetical protein